MARKPPVSLRKPPAAVDLQKVEEFVRKSEAPAEIKAAPEDVQAPETPSVQPPEPPAVKTSKRPKVRKKLPKSVVARSDGRTLRRMTVYLPDDLARELAVHCAREDLEISTVVTQAVRKVLKRVQE